MISCTISAQCLTKKCVVKHQMKKESILIQKCFKLSEQFKNFPFAITSHYTRFDVLILRSFPGLFLYLTRGNSSKLIHLLSKPKEPKVSSHVQKLCNNQKQFHAC